MKIAFPVQSDQGMRSPVFNHFGSAPLFVVIDSDTYAATSVSNADRNHIHGQCQPMAALNGITIDAVIVGGIGPGALRQLRNRGIQVLKAAPGTVGENLQLFTDGQLVQFGDNDICAGHGKAGCAH
jgi:predicted Fe-Mo cluster-binding NifX family protein